MRLEKKFLIGFVISVFVFAIYFATQVSAVYPPIKSYEFTLTKDELRFQLDQIVKSQSTLSFVLTDSIGTEKDGRDYHCDIIINGPNKLEYNIIYKKENSFWDNNVKSEIELIGAWDKTRWIGGYRIEDPEVEKLIGVFENQIINKLDKNTSR